MAVKFAPLKTKADCDREINAKMKKLAEVRRRLKGNNTPHVRAGLVQEERSLQEDIKAIKRHKDKLKQ